VIKLDELTNQEDRLIQQVRQVHGSMEEKTEQLQHLGVFEQYRAIHDAYAALISNPSDEAEAKKRALFIQWYAVSEPMCFTGISELNGDTQRFVLEQIQKDVDFNRLDHELTWMTPWYYAISNWYFDDLFYLPTLQQYLRQGQGRVHLPRAIAIESFDNRGQMGRYWLSVFKQRETSKPSST